jgi:hypothetical protein
MEKTTPKPRKNLPVLAKVEDGVQETLFALEGLIFKKKDVFDEVSKELKAQKESLQNIYENDKGYSEAAEKVAEAKKVLLEHKARVKKNLEVQQIEGKIKETRECKKDVQLSLSNDLISWYAISKSTTIEGKDGKILTLRTNVKLIKE